MKKYVLLTISNLFIFLFLPVLRLFNKNIYEKNILPKIINYTCNTNPVGHQRKKIIPNAFGVVLEIGSGSG
ncbi:MAG: SAM-dependent methyltransferase, partial [Actinomycetota bacterium]|nr:SAM-dependent methyltransferase [Actinomycetota bacterium]